MKKIDNYVVFLHGFGAKSDFWASLLSFLPDGYNYITLEYAELTNCQTMDQYAEWLRKELLKRKIEKFVLVGHSMGGYIAMAFANKWPQSLLGLVMFHSTSFADSEERVKARKKTIRFIGKNGSAPFIRNFLPSIFNEKFGKKNKLYLQKLISKYESIPMLALQSASLAMSQRPDTSQILKNIEIPVLFILGEKDGLIPLDTGLKQVAFLRQPYSLVLENSAHSGMIEEPLRCAEKLKDFLLIC